VFLGDMGVGKTSIIDRFIRDEFDPTNNVDTATHSQLSVSTFSHVILLSTIPPTAFNFGIPLAKKNTKALSLPTCVMQMQPFSSTTSLANRV
jgi:GTPase SAR1 family protein